MLTAVARREQSDSASKLIGEKLLQGYCLLDEVCPTETCYGVHIPYPRMVDNRFLYYDYPAKQNDALVLFVGEYTLK